MKLNPVLVMVKPLRVIADVLEENKPTLAVAEEIVVVNEAAVVEVAAV